MIAEQHCESTVYIKPININGVEIKGRKNLQEIYWVEVNKKKHLIPKRSSNTYSAKKKFADSLPSYVIEIAKLDKDYSNCISIDEGFIFSSENIKAVDKRTGQNLIFNEREKFYYLPKK